ncbi:MAG: DUF4443 domain-containing protein [Thermoproteota archaeon]|nr:hypothetical protein [Candidatus Brockarchaeota archaeon]MBO3768136.1 hypothetical protein [Candidatus Brockarchaeota archaeon]MBO3801343.1 hypothetical protein [Candidatus Brockarchaeota archaeon]
MSLHKTLKLEDALKILAKVIEEDEIRPKSFHIGHVVLAMLELDREKPISREKLSSLLGLGGGAIRSLLTRLNLNHLISITYRGIRLRGVGIEINKKLRENIDGPFEVELEYLSVDAYDVAFIIKGLEKEKFKPLEIRDLVVRFGGTGATLCIYSKDKIEVPFVIDDLIKQSLHDYYQLKKLGLNEDNLILIVSAPSVVSAKVSGTAAIASILQKIE